MWHVWKRKRFIQDFGWKPKERDHSEDLGVDGKKISKWIFKKWVGDIHWTDLSEDTDRWRTL
jgi:hypothetical protein